MVKKIRASGANVLLIQKSILRDAVTDLSLHYLVRERVTVVVLLDDRVGGAGMLCVECGAGQLTCSRLADTHAAAASVRFVCRALCLDPPNHHLNGPPGRPLHPTLDTHPLPTVSPPPRLPRQAKAKIMVIKDVEREDIEFISKTLHCLPIAHVDHMRPEKLGHADLVEEMDVSSGSVRRPLGWHCAECMHINL